MLCLYTQRDCRVIVKNMERSSPRQLGGGWTKLQSKLAQAKMLSLLCLFWQVTYNIKCYAIDSERWNKLFGIDVFRKSAPVYDILLKWTSRWRSITPVRFTPDIYLPYIWWVGIDSHEFLASWKFLYYMSIFRRTRGIKGQNFSNIIFSVRIASYVWTYKH